MQGSTIQLIIFSIVIYMLVKKHHQHTEKLALAAKINVEAKPTWDTYSSTTHTRLPPNSLKRGKIPYYYTYQSRPHIIGHSYPSENGKFVDAKVMHYH